MLLGGVPLVLVAGGESLLRPEAVPFWPHWSLGQWGLMAYAALLGSALAYGLFFWFASSGDLTGFTALTFLTPVFAVLCGVLLLEERLGPLQWLGAVLALISVLLINQRGRLWQASGRTEPAAP
jgi:drug/metabolite transporter (DMT)-like permease